MNRRALIGVGVALVLALAAVWYFASPGYAMMQLRDAAKEGDSEELKERIDFPAVRDSLKSQFRTHVMAEMKREQEDNPFGALGGMIAMGMVNAMIDSFVTPEGLAVMIESGEIGEPGVPAQRSDVEWSIQRHGLDEFRATPEVPDGERAPTIVFTRDGFSWTLSRIDIPEEGLGGQ